MRHTRCGLLAIDDLDTLARALDDNASRGRGRVARLWGPGAQRLAAAWCEAHGQVARLSLSDEERPAAGVWFDDGPHAVAAADLYTGWSVLDPTLTVLLTGRSTDGGHPDIGVSAWVESRGPETTVRSTEVRPLPPCVPDDVIELYRRGETLLAATSVEVCPEADRPGLGWVELLRLIAVSRADDAIALGWTLAERGAHPGWTRLGLALAYWDCDLLEPMQAALEVILQRDRDPRLLADANLYLNMLSGDATPAQVTDPDASPIARALVAFFRRDLAGPLDRMSDALHPPRDAVVLLRRGFYTGVPAIHGLIGFNRSRRRLGEVVKAVRAGRDPRSLPVPRPGHGGRAEYLAALIRALAALAVGDTVRARASALELDRSVCFGTPASAVEGLVEAGGEPWARATVLAAVERTVSRTVPLDALRRSLHEARVASRALDDYILEGVIARGAMGEVWGAQHVPTSHPVAIKVLSGAATAREIALFESEVDLISTLDHPSIVAVLDRGRVSASDSRYIPMDAGQSYLVMERISGGTLDARVGGLAWEDVRAIAVALLDALGYAHAKGVLHRDIKPANVLLANDGSLRLSDFGLAGLPWRGRVAGSPTYMAPEQFEGRADPRSDLYGLAVLVWTLLCGAPPWIGSFERLRTLPRDQLPTFQPLVAVPAELEQWLARALQPAPDARFPHAHAMSTALAAVGGERIAPAGPGPSMEPSVGTTLDVGTLLGLPEPLGSPSAVAPRTFRSSVPPLPFSGQDWYLRPRLPTHRLLETGDAPVLGRHAEKDALWNALSRAGAGEDVHVHLAGPFGSGRRTLARWLTERAARAGLTQPPSALRIEHMGEGDPEPARDPFTLRLWTRPPAAGFAGQVITLARLRDQEVGWALASRVHAAEDVLVRATRRACGYVDLGLALIRDWVDGPGLAPTPAGLRLVAPEPERLLRAEAFWMSRLEDVSEGELRALAALSLRSSWTPSNLERVLDLLGLVPVDLTGWTCPVARAVAIPPSLRSALRVRLDDATWSELRRAVLSVTGERDIEALELLDDPAAITSRLDAIGPERWPFRLSADGRSRAWRACFVELRCSQVGHDLLLGVGDADPVARLVESVEMRRVDRTGVFGLLAVSRGDLEFSREALAAAARVHGRLPRGSPWREGAAIAVARMLHARGDIPGLRRWYERLRDAPNAQAYAVARLSGLLPPDDAIAAIDATLPGITWEWLRVSCASRRMGALVDVGRFAEALQGLQSLEGLTTGTWITDPLLFSALANLGIGELDVARRDLSHWLLVTEHGRDYGELLALGLFPEFPDWWFERRVRQLTPIPDRSLHRALRSLAERCESPARAPVLARLAEACRPAPHARDGAGES